MRAVITESLCRFVQIARLIGDRPGGKFQTLGRHAPGAKTSSKPAGVNKARRRSRGERITNACGLNLGMNTHSPSFTLNASYIDVELSFQDVEELVLARMHVRRRFGSGRQDCLHQEEGSVGILGFCEVGC